MDEPLRVVQIHVDLVKEFEVMKKELEEKSGYPVRGGNATVSKLVAEILRNLRDERKRKEYFKVTKNLENGKKMETLSLGQDFKPEYRLQKVKGEHKKELFLI